MTSDHLVRQIAGVAALDEPVRRELYFYVIAQPQPVTRDEAASGIDVARHTAKFHLDRLVDDGLLDVDFKRMSGREGPGAGRPTKRYRRADADVAVSLPERRYALAGDLMATAIEVATSTGTNVDAALQQAAANHGAEIGTRVAERLAAPAASESVADAMVNALAEFGYEPRVTDEGITMVNCPFHSIAQAHTELVCGMNLAMLQAAVAHSDDGSFEARLSPAPDRCCVVLTTR